MKASDETDPDALLAFWFGGADLDAAPADARRRWFQSTAADDAEIRARFASLHARAAAGDLREWEASPRGRVALILALDQLSRQLYRGSPRAFAFDAEAERLCREGQALGHDRDLPILGRAFFCMPLHHAEDVDAQARSVECFDRLGAACPPTLAALVGDFFTSAVEHADVVCRFGRFPHRNAILGRASTPAEIAYLASGGATYGQAAT